MLCLDHTITKKMREPAFAAEWDSLEPEELPQMRRAVHQKNLKKAEETETSRLGFSISYKLEPRPPDM